MSYIKQFADPEGGYTFEECYFNDAKDLIQTGVLGFCGCGNLEENLLFVRDALALIETRRKIAPSSYADVVAKEIELFGNKRSRDFVYYSLDKLGLTEHGGAIPGWLTEKGKQLLDDLNRLSPELRRTCA